MNDSKKRKNPKKRKETSLYLSRPFCQEKMRKKEKSKKLDVEICGNVEKNVENF